ncbi:23S rRNA (cytosine1962-C5)-methyltransferase [Pedobacter cryoconitis]|uniref:23S rRNA (Cytosine1962-C5)-methyltransferase n=1 Tax=Pedobacter cryoconitis TaxID=188932 RepID=A0A7W8ZK92_9SPHI|nr:class I SAM-dependent rRNA methyltransferase [Pedobacter cryoconitis]MBB5635417.1 23S rRNA (cytosine1962-C5)-methyltransferase [Pedobacter cryoconitis]MBB6273721.1 23S rRNA (cytosine1962-C5)-methyltransferase [Pedobacter cryoconitis]
MIDVVLKKGKEKAVHQKHPWIFSGAIDKVKGNPLNGEVIRVLAADQSFLGYGYYNGQSRVAVRLLEWEEDNIIDKAWYELRLKNAIASRAHLLSDLETNTCRLVFSEADYLPGLIVDKYADYLSLQILSAGMENVKAELIEILIAELNPIGIFDKSDANARTHENLEVSQGLLWGETPPEFIEVKENGVRYHINIADGQKSGFYCDQRDNREILAAYTKDKEVLDCFCYSGGFTLNSLKHGAKHLTSVDSSALAIETLKHNLGLNGFMEHQQTSIQSDVNKQLRTFKEEGKLFDVIVLDPPKYAPSRSALDRAARAYKDLNRLGMLLLKKGGILATYSCSGAVDLETFKQIIAWAALDAGREVQIIKQFHQPEDHPVRISFPEGEYLKGLLLRVL